LASYTLFARVYACACIWKHDVTGRYGRECRPPSASWRWTSRSREHRVAGRFHRHGAGGRREDTKVK
jgi:hypothetical protein